MELRRILYFIETARHGSFTIAAEKLGISQPALSCQVSLLERDLKQTLIDRSQKKIRLTLQGERFLKKALKFKDDYLDLMEEASGTDDKPSGSYVISSGGTVSAWILPEVIKSITDKYPGISFHVIEGDAVTTKEAVIRGSADLGILTEKIEEEGIVSRILINDTVVPVVSKNHPLSRKKKISPDELLAEKMVLFHPQSSIRRLVETVWKNFPDYKPDMIMELRGIESVLRSIKAGLGVGFISALSLDKDLKILNCPFIFMKRTFYICYRKNKRTEALSELLEKNIKLKSGRTYGPES